jgi:hypothetical protein
MAFGDGFFSAGLIFFGMARFYRRSGANMDGPTAYKGSLEQLDGKSA